MSTLLKLGAVLLAGYFVYQHYIGQSLPDVSALKTRNPSHTAYMGGSRRSAEHVWVSFDSIPQSLKRAVLVSEDGSFYSHHGVDFHELKESILRNIRDGGYARGFSTITMQLARNLYLKPEKSILRKVREIAIAFHLERNLSKDRIFELYLNLIEWGRGVYGIEAAAQHYFGKSAAELNSLESIFLAAIIPGPQRLGRWPPTDYVQERMQSIAIRVDQRWSD